MNYSQMGNMMGDRDLGSRVRQMMDGSGPADIGQNGGDAVDVPSEPGPALAGRTPIVGSLRRSNDMPVARDQLGDMLGN